MDTTQADAYAAERNYTDWTAKGTPEKTAALLRASDYITARYPLRVTLTDAEQARLDAAQFLIARDLLLNSKPLSIREEARVLKESKEGAGFKKETEYADEAVDPYPGATALLAPLAPKASSVSFGKMVRR